MLPLESHMQKIVILRYSEESGFKLLSQRSAC